MWFPLLLAVSIQLVVADVCPSGSQTCAKGMTCCELPSGGEGCCPYENATCCSDKVHCCPHGYHCLTGRCQKEDTDVSDHPAKLMVAYEEPDNTIPEFYQNASHAVNGQCPDGSSCPDGNTCCQMTGGRYGCCPFPSAMCCSDREHCCPQGFICNATGYCIREDVRMIFKISDPVKQTALKQEPVNMVCPGGQYTCPDKDTCCSMGQGEWGCCPLTKATCCPDKLHCCPHGSRCDPQGYCIQ